MTQKKTDAGKAGRKDGALARDFFYPPFSVLDAKQGWWQERKKLWLGLGIASDKGRPRVQDSMTAAWKVKMRQSGNDDSGAVPAWADTSIFDPVLAEICYRWFCPPGGHIFDAFAGGSVRGIVASKLGYRYTGFDIRPEQVEENIQQAKALDCDPFPRWRVKDACAKSLYVHFKGKVDFLFSCPPYGDLEVYSDDPADVSTMPWDMFAGAMRHSIKQQVQRLNDNRFAVYVVSDIRDSNGTYRGLPATVTESFKEAGMRPYGEVILLNQLGTLPIRVRGMFENSRKVGRAHQNVLVFVKGCPVAATAALGDVPCKPLF